ncbi:hypothetical protein DAPK24_008210 [Pichia kluyveri]|uniref:Uncharacterized protein n=1 Tax=Pichia kluyveri TaxID=36015 RepID=A0AAV5R0T7_PICKL|nr:hypothetical protein DAPK24_008210 [Pichia kluyveri]
MEESIKYLTSIDESYNLLLDSLSILQSNNFNISSLNKIQQNIIFDSINLINNKNNFKLLINNLLLENISIIKQNDIITNNSQLLLLEIQKFKLNQSYNLLYNLLLNLPILNFQNLQSPPSFQLDYPNDKLFSEIYNRDDLNLTDLHNIPDNYTEIIENSVKNELNEKFKLIQLHDEIYQNKLNNLQLMDNKWKSELINIKSFINNDVHNLKSELSNKLSQL